MSELYSLSVPWKKGTYDFAQNKGKVILVFNSATKCGFTPQLKAIQQLYTDYKDQGFEVIGFPSNQFGSQNPQGDEDTDSFCQVNYGVDFPMVNKSDVNGNDTNPVFKLLKKEKKGYLGERIVWNFTKFLVDRNGKVYSRYAPTTTPESIKGDIEKLLAQPAQ